MTAAATLWRRARAAETPLLVGAALFAPLGAVAPKGLAPLFFVLALWQLLLLWREGRLGAAVRTPLAYLLGATALWSCVTIFWTVSPDRGGGTGLKLVTISLGAVVLLAQARRFDEATRRRLGDAMIGGFIAAFAYLGAEVLSGAALHQLLPTLGITSGFKMAVLNRRLAILLFAAWMVAIALRGRGYRWLALCAPMAVTIVIFGGDGKSVKLAALSSLGAGVIAWAGGRIVHTAAAVVVIAFMAAAPFLPASVLAPEKYQELLQERYYSALHRLYIWRFAADRIAEKPVRGWGLEAAPNTPGGDVLLETGGFLMNVHPHSATFQVWLELGLPGIVLAAAIVVFAFRGAQRLPARLPSAAAFGVIVATLVIANLSFSLWQTWWLATFALLAALIAALARTDGTSSA